jgi:hypothetical protein
MLSVAVTRAVRMVLTYAAAASDTMMPMITITTKSSINVKPARRRVAVPVAARLW